MTSVNADVVLWPRHEVHQLVNTPLAQHGRHLTHAVAMDIARQLAKIQSSDKSISYEQWSAVARDTMKWNDLCIRIFWDMLHMACWYKQKADWSQYSDFTNVGHLIVFLVLHAFDTTPRAHSPNTAYDAVWPGYDTTATMSPPPGSHVSPPSSPKSGRKTISSTGAPMSPRTLTRQASIPSSPRRAMLSQAKTSSQHLNTLREKLTTLLTALAMQESISSETDCVSEPKLVMSKIQSTDSLEEVGSRAAEFMVTPWVIDALNLIVAGGIDKSEEVPHLSSLCPFWNTGDESEEGFRLMSASVDSVGRDAASPQEQRQVSVAQAVEWIEQHILLNDVLYPSNSIQTYNSALNSSRDQMDSPRLGVEQPELPVVQMPTRRHLSFEEFADNRAIFSGGSSTTMHILSHSPDSEETMTGDDASGSESNLAGPLSGLVLQKEIQDGADSPMSEKYLHATGSVAGPTLSPLLIQNSIKMVYYFLGAYSHCTISASSDCEVIIGAVAGTVHLVGCERISITVACRKLVLNSCLDCKVRLASLAPTVICGDSRGLVIGPYNTTYRSLRNHLRYAGLDSFLTGAETNMWDKMQDVTSSTEVIYSPRQPSPVPEGVPDTTASVQLPAYYTFCTIPYKAEHQQPEMCPIALPKQFRESYVSRKQSLVDLQRRISMKLTTNAKGADETFGLMLSKRFTEWCNHHGKTSQIVDLIRMDAGESDANQAEPMDM